ncbi:hypothetical protein ABTH42_19345, partial [Acinetobacter baumannii]
MRRRVLKFRSVVLRHLAPAVLALLIGSAGAFGPEAFVPRAFAQSGNPTPPEQQGKNAPDSKSADAVKDNER